MVMEQHPTLLLLLFHPILAHSALRAGGEFCTGDYDDSNSNMRCYLTFVQTRLLHTFNVPFLLTVDAYFNLFNYADNSAKKILDLMHCFRGDLPDVKDIIGLVLEEYTPRTYIITNDIEVRKTFSEIVGDFFITAPTHLSAHILSTKNVSVYVYDFGYQSAFDDHGGKYPFPTGVPTPDGAIHGAELVYLTGAPMVGHKYLRFDESDKKMSEMLLMLWGNFVKQGIPSLSRPQQDFHIRRYTVSSPDYAALFNESGTPVIEMSSNLKPDKMAFWNFKVPQMYREQFGGLTPEVVRFPEAGHVNRKVPTWGLTTACVSLAVLSSLLAVLYCRTRRQVKRLIKQTSASSGTCKTNHV